MNASNAETDLADVMSTPLSALLGEAWRVRCQNHPRTVLFAAPGFKYYDNEFFHNEQERFASISVTGKTCALNCKHCGGKLLETMLDCRDPGELAAMGRRLRENGCEGILVSGGADASGAVPLLPFMDSIARLKGMGFKVLVHTGLASDEVLAGLSRAGVDQLMVDIIGSNETVREVYHLDKTTDDYLDFMRRCRAHGLELAPHLVLGLHFGKILGELEALRMITAMRPKRIVIVVLCPKRGTEMEQVAPPDAADCGRIIALARTANPTAYLSLGCARPAGNRAALIEQFALNAGVNAIAFPCEETIELAKEMGLKARYSNMCCVLDPEPAECAK